MSNRVVPHQSPKLLRRVACCFVLLLLPEGAWAQSPALLEAIRVHADALAEAAQGELSACEGAKPKPCPQRERLSLITGVLLLAEGKAAEAAKQLSAVKAPKGLEAFHGWYWGEAQAWAGLRSEAIKTLQKAKKAAPPWLARRIDLRLAELWLDVGQATKARPILDAVDDPGPEVLLARALAKEATSDGEAARADYRLLYLRYPTHPHAAAAKRLHEKTKPLALAPEELFRRAQGQLNSGASAATLETLKSLPAADQKSARAALLEGQALLSLGKDEPAFSKLEFATKNGAPSVAAEALLTQAKRQMRLGDNVGARATFRSLDDKYPTDVNADEAGYFAAWLLLGLDDDLGAAEAFAGFEERHPNSRRKDEARWFRSYALLRAHKHGPAREALLTLIADFPKSSLVPQAKYWATRAAQLERPAGDVDGGAKPDAGVGSKVDLVREYLELVNGFAGTYYALLATERLQELHVEVPVAFAAKPRPLSPAPKVPASLMLAVELSKTGLLRDASEEVNRALAQVSASDALSFGHALQALNEFGAAHAVAARWLWGAVYTAKQPEALALMYPRAYQASVEASAEEVDLAPELAWAIMRRESGFRTEVYSPADARGLMQIIPPTAKAIAAEMKRPAPHPDELFSPATNIQFGTWYLAALLKRMGHVALCAAAYNAGPSAVLKWVAQKGTLPLDQWVEEIPYKETRGYVKQVVADLFVYQQLYGQRAPLRLPLTLPVPKSAGVEF